MEDRDELLRHFADMRAALVAAIDGLSDDSLSEPSLDGWSVKDHLAHLALWDDLRASEVVRISAGHESAWQGGEWDPAFSEIAYQLRRALSVAQVRWELETSRQRLLDAIAAATPRGLDASLYGEAALRSTHEAAHTAWIAAWRHERGQ
jgi:DinB superfamily